MRKDLDLPSELPEDFTFTDPAGLTSVQAEEALHQAVADTCYQVLCDAGVYKQDEAGQEGLKRFLKYNSELLTEVAEKLK